MPETPYDVVIIGGGITGAGIARDASLRGLRVALFEKGDFASGTSSKSSKLIHGGLRYLERGEIALVFESVSERRVQMRVAPHLVRPVSFLAPVFKDSRVGLELMNIGLWIYEILAFFRSPKLHKTMRGPDAVLNAEPDIRSDGLTGAIEFYDCSTDDSRLALENIESAKKEGARCDSYTEVTEIIRKRGRVCAVKICDVLTGTQSVVTTHAVIMATGPWSDQANSTLNARMSAPLLSPTKGVHAVFPRELLPLQRIMTILSPVDGRVMFAIPWCGRTVIGTTDTHFDGDPSEVHATAGDVQYLCTSANHLFPNANLKADDVISTWAGLRPLIHQEAESASHISREHQIYVHNDGVILVAGGKLTTYRLMAEDTVTETILWLQTWKNDHFSGRTLRAANTNKRCLPGAEGLADASELGVGQLALDLAAEFSLPIAITKHWAFTYGTKARVLADLVMSEPRLLDPVQTDLIYTWAEIEFAIQNEHVVTIDDVLARRVPLLLVATDQGLDSLEKIADRMARAFGWDQKRRDIEVRRYQHSVASSRQFRVSP